VPSIPIRDAAEVLGVSDDTVRRWIDQNKLPSRLESGRRVVDGTDLAALALLEAARRPPGRASRRRDTMHNRFCGVVTALHGDGAVVRLEVQAGPHRFVSLVSRESAEGLQLEPGAVVVATVNAADVGVELPATSKRRRAASAP
jgi:molybdopterin-binding protein